MQEIEYKKYFKGKKITKQGFGFLGRGANVVKFLLECGADVLVTDMKTERDLEQSIKEIEDFILEKNIDKNKIIYRLGEHKLEDFDKIKMNDGEYVSGCDFVIQASGVAKDNKFLLHAKEMGVKVYQESSLFVDIIREYNSNLEKDILNKKELKKNKIKIIGVTGTRGKTTTTFLIKNIIDKYLEKENIKAYFGGNVQGVATLENLKYVKGGDVMVMELDSWILQGFADIKYSPDIAVFTTFMPDHMNYYKGDMSDYFLDKAAIFLNQKESDVFISTDKIRIDTEKYFDLKNKERNSNLKSEKYFLDNAEMQNYNTKYKSLLLGEHNKINLALAVKASEEFMKSEGASDEEIKNTIQEVLNTFTGVAGRLEFVRELNGVKYYNDTTATTPDALMVALETFKDKNIILVCGGRDKELDIADAAKKIIDFKNKNIIKEIILLNDETTTGTHKLIKLFEENNFVVTNYILKGSLRECVEGAARSAAPGDIILFSPGFASFGMFLNEYDRGEKFNRLVNNFE